MIKHWCFCVLLTKNVSSFVVRGDVIVVFDVKYVYLFDDRVVAIECVG